MDDLAEALASSLFGLALLIAFGAVIGAGWLLYKLFERVLIPLSKDLWRELERGVQDFLAWYREVTWRRRMMRIHNEAVRAIDATRRDHVLLAEAAIGAVEVQQLVLTADETAVVRSAVAAS